MPDKIPVVLCSGTTCYVLGNAQLLGLEDLVEPDIKDTISIESASCLGYCKEPKYGKAPFAKVGGHVLPEATPARISYFVRVLLASRE